MNDKKAIKDTRTRAWTCVVYPESAPKGWIDIINDMHIKWVCSPLHDKDINATGEVKKAHWHILFLFEGKKSYEQIKEITDRINAPAPQSCHDAKALVRYMSHLDNPDKAQYSTNDIKVYGGVDLAELLSPSSAEKQLIIDEMMSYVKNNKIMEFQDLADYARENEPSRWFSSLCNNSMNIMTVYIRSQRHRYKNVDLETGEIHNR
jgi:hypothetical protein